jgi:hypothetical protein
MRVAYWRGALGSECTLQAVDQSFARQARGDFGAIEMQQRLILLGGADVRMIYGALSLWHGANS